MNDLVAAVRHVYDRALPAAEQWDLISAALQRALRDPELRQLAAVWPQSHDTANRRFTNLLFYEDVDHGFVVNGLVKDQIGRTPVHDHGHAWVAYGLLEGAETIVRYASAGQQEPTGFSDMAVEAEFGLSAGDVDLVAPWTFHAEQADTERTVAIMVRSAKVGVFAHRRFDPETGEIYEHPGPAQIDYSFT